MLDTNILKISYCKKNAEDNITEMRPYSQSFHAVKFSQTGFKTHCYDNSPTEEINFTYMVIAA